MDPNQRLVLEVAYDTMFSMGMNKAKIMNAAGGIYVGHAATEWGFAEKQTKESSAHGATGGAPSITSNRISFCLGLKGPSMTIDTEGSSSMTALCCAGDAVQVKGRATPNSFSVGLGTHLMLGSVWWPMNSKSGWLSAIGRCLTFDEKANGYVRMDAVVGVSLKPVAEPDGKDPNPALGLLASIVMNNNGRASSLSSPNGAAEQDMIADAVHNAGISHLDVDAVEAHGAGCVLADAVEIGSIARGHRSLGPSQTIGVTASKTCGGNPCDAAGITAFLKVVRSARLGVMMPTMHLHVRNPHMEQESPTLITSEALEFRMKASYTGTLSRGFGGTNAYALSWGHVLEQAAFHVEARQISFWPGGGGSVELAKLPDSSYYIIGSWLEWKEAVPMEDEGDGVWGLTVVLGENRWEEFQILLDGDRSRVLHPGAAKAQVAAVQGPDQQAAGLTWLIDGSEADWDTEKQDALADAVPRQNEQYRIRLQVVGKWRSVEWHRLLPDAPERSARPAAPGRYYISGSWNHWMLEEMTASGDAGVHSAKVKLLRRGGDFQIVRNRDWAQTLYPSVRQATASGAVVRGPDDGGSGFFWHVNGEAGDVCRIELQRPAGEDVIKVAWQRLSTEALTPLEVALVSQTRYCIIGSWDDWRGSRLMQWDSTSRCHVFMLQLGASAAPLSFLILQGGRWDAVLFPGEEHATPQIPHALLGPSGDAHGHCWTVGQPEEADVAAGARYEVKLHLDQHNRPRRVEWQLSVGDSPLADEFLAGR